MNSKEFDSLKESIYLQAKQAKDFAVYLEFTLEDMEGALSWYSVMDSLNEAHNKMDAMQNKVQLSRLKTVRV